MNIASVVQGLASVMWLVALGVLGFTVFNAARGRKFGGGATLVVGAVVLAVALTVVAAGIVFIEPDERGVVISPYDQRGYRDTALTPGLRWIIPGERVQTYSIARQSYTMSSAEAEARSRAMTRSRLAPKMDKSSLWMLPSFTRLIPIT